MKVSPENFASRFLCTKEIPPAAVQTNSKTQKVIGIEEAEFETFLKRWKRFEITSEKFLKLLAAFRAKSPPIMVGKDLFDKGLVKNCLSLTDEDVSKLKEEKWNSEERTISLNVLMQHIRIFQAECSFIQNFR